MRVEAHRLDYEDDRNDEVKFVDLVDYLISYSGKKSQEAGKKIFKEF